MAPEQVRGGQESDARADVWSVCVVFYELVSSRPVRRPDSISIVHDVLRVAPPRPEALEAHPRLWEIIERGLAKTPDGRFHDHEARAAAARLPSGRSRPGSGRPRRLGARPSSTTAPCAGEMRGEKPPRRQERQEKRE